MKSLKTLIVLALVAMIAACGGEKKDTAAVQKKLDELRKEQATISTEIKKLEDELAAADPAAADAKLKMVALMPLENKEFIHYTEIQGTVLSDENIVLAPRMPGPVMVVHVVEGQQVKKGQVLAEMDGSVLRSSLAEVENQYDLVKNVFSRTENLWKQKIGTEMNYITAKNNLQAAEKRLATIKEQLDQTLIKSPINGTVDLVNLKVGEAPNPQEIPLRVVNTSKLKVKADVAESYARSVKQGNDVVLSFPDINKEVKTRLNYVGKTIDPLKRTFAVESKLSNSNDYRANMLAVLKIIDYRNKSAIVIPVNAVQNSDEGTFVFLAKGNGKQRSVEKRLISLGNTYNDVAEVKSGLTKGDQLITAGFQSLNEGQTVRVE